MEIDREGNELTAQAAGLIAGEEPVVQTENIGMVFGKKDNRQVLALKDLNIQVYPGEFVTLLGPSGCGKSTTFHIVAGLLRPTHGRVLVDGRDVTGETGHVAYMFQKDLLLPWRTVLANMTLGAEAQDMDRKQAQQEAKELLVKLGLAGRGDDYPSQLSGGMRQRVAFGRTLLMHKELLLLDEPLGALDAQTREYMQEWLLDVFDEFKKTVLLISHDLDEAIFLADRIYVLTKQPGTVKAEIRVDLPRPRSAADRFSPTFSQIRSRLYNLIREEEVEI
jgi:ABC-type nitrate/sulfonate/bicarbonate transport system ATPase subunit